MLFKEYRKTPEMSTYSFLRLSTRSKYTNQGTTISIKITQINFLRYYVVARLLYKHIILQEVMSWLSTLGGGFSCLGDKFEDAVRFHIAFSTTVYLFVTDTPVFFLLIADSIIPHKFPFRRSVYKFSREAPFCDNPPELHLDLMCRGLWTRLVYLWNLKREERMKRRLNLTDADREVFLKDSQSIGSDCSESSAARRIFPDISKILNTL
ncbi:unnamed protein product [Dibothriocephalus latus]|uniref:Uncharacterized protein n=1 Tax=Dibothriocephalus latus TaxID=60516 RepID=A0A3P7PXA8_DIBLA|nr:unnamed protein product [Dibothriocephalus latus]